MEATPLGGETSLSTIVVNGSQLHSANQVHPTKHSQIEEAINTVQISQRVSVSGMKPQSGHGGLYSDSLRYPHKPRWEAKTD
ncbi:hypothetical protein [Shewanella waksmanii]|uniref:hypothetical protein n=1 Tax=Shewanella waksmanii TaxID=213783 RepID=UPI0004B8EE0A|nr:hypothetical protein [Shewanella waksmanii]